MYFKHSYPATASVPLVSIYLVNPKVNPKNLYIWFKPKHFNYEKNSINIHFGIGYCDFFKFGFL